MALKDKLDIACLLIDCKKAPPSAILTVTEEFALSGHFKSLPISFFTCYFDPTELLLLKSMV
jgi:hypothetical protein